MQVANTLKPIVSVVDCKRIAGTIVHAKEDRQVHVWARLQFQKQEVGHLVSFADNSDKKKM
jgi:hypothetical protein